MSFQSGVYPAVRSTKRSDDAKELVGHFEKPPDPSRYRDGDRIRMRTRVREAAGDRTYRVTYVHRRGNWFMLYAELMTYPERQHEGC